MRTSDLWCVVYVQLLTWVRHLPHRIHKEMLVNTTAKANVKFYHTEKLQKYKRTIPFVRCNVSAYWCKNFTLFFPFICFHYNYFHATENGLHVFEEYTENWVEITLMPNRQGHCPKVRQCRIFKKYSLNSESHWGSQPQSLK